VSVRVEELGSHRTEFSEIGHFFIFLKSAENIQVLLKSAKNNGALREEQCTFFYI
jgi:uncharacterized membrane protein YjdF